MRLSVIEFFFSFSTEKYYLAKRGNETVLAHILKLDGRKHGISDFISINH